MNTRIAVLGHLFGVFLIGVSAGSAYAQGTSKAKSFDSASITPAGAPRPGFNMNSSPGCGFNGLQIDSRHVVITAPLYTLIYLAYDGNCRVTELLAGEAAWMRSERYDIDAMIPAGAPAYTPAQLAARDAPALQRMR